MDFYIGMAVGFFALWGLHEPASACLEEWP